MGVVGIDVPVDPWNGMEPVPYETLGHGTGFVGNDLRVIPWVRRDRPPCRSGYGFVGTGFHAGPRNGMPACRGCDADREPVPYGGTAWKLFPTENIGQGSVGIGHRADPQWNGMEPVPYLLTFHCNKMPFLLSCWHEI
jgi:hypothetical protein